MNPKFKGFAQSVLEKLCEQDSCATRLHLTKGTGARLPVVGFDDNGEFVPVLRLDNPSVAANTMSLSVHLHNRWQPTMHRGTPAELASLLAGPLQHLWAIPLVAAEFDPLHSVSE